MLQDEPGDRRPDRVPVRYPLALRDVGDLLQERGIDVSQETVRFWWHRFGPMVAARFRRKRVDRMRSLPHLRWPLNKVFAKIIGVTHCLWPAVDHEGEVLEGFGSKQRHRKTALKFLRKTTRRHGHPPVFGTDKLRSCGAALKDLGLPDDRETGRWRNNRAEDSRQPVRRREHPMLCFRRMRPRRKFVAVHSSTHNRFDGARTLTGRNTFKTSRAAAFAEWRQFFGALHRAGLGRKRRVRICLMVWTAPPRRHRTVQCWCCVTADKGRIRPHGDYNTRDRSGQDRVSASRR